MGSLELNENELLVSLVRTTLLIIEDNAQFKEFFPLENTSEKLWLCSQVLEQSFVEIYSKQCGLKDCSEQQKLLITRFLELKMTNNSHTDDIRKLMVKSMLDIMVKSMLDMNTSKKSIMEKLKPMIFIFFIILIFYVTFLVLEN